MLAVWSAQLDKSNLVDSHSDVNTNKKTIPTLQ